MLKYYFDTETSDLIKGKDFNNFQRHPSMLAFCGKLIGPDGALVSRFNSLIKVPHNPKISPGAFAANKLTIERCNDEGVPLVQAIEWHIEACRQADLAVGFNLQFDLDMLEISFWRAVALENWEYVAHTPPRVVELRSYADIYTRQELGKWPKLSDAMRIICGVTEYNAHTAEGDVDACILLHKTIKERQDGNKEPHSQSS